MVSSWVISFVDHFQRREMADVITEAVIKTVICMLGCLLMNLYEKFFKPRAPPNPPAAEADLPFDILLAQIQSSVAEMQANLAQLRVILAGVNPERYTSAHSVSDVASRSSSRRNSIASSTSSTPDPVFSAEQDYLHESADESSDVEKRDRNPVRRPCPICKRWGPHRTCQRRAQAMRVDEWLKMK